MANFWKIFERDKIVNLSWNSNPTTSKVEIKAELVRHNEKWPNFTSAREILTKEKVVENSEKIGKISVIFNKMQNIFLRVIF